MIQDIKRLAAAYSLARTTQVECRELWHRLVVQRQHDQYTFSRHISVQDVSDVLDHLEREGKRPLQATAFTFHSMFKDEKIM